MALKICHEQTVNVAVLDIRMPGMDGLRLLKALRAENPEIKVIINTGHATLELAINAVNEEAFAFVTKMGNVEELTASLAASLPAMVEDMRTLAARIVASQRTQVGEEPQVIRKFDVIDAV